MSGVLLTAFGGPSCTTDIAPFMCRLMGREPSEEVLDRAVRKYLTIGGRSPLPAIAEEIANGLREAFEEQRLTVPVAVGMRYSEPFIAEALAELAEAGEERVVMASLSPFESGIAHGAYREAVEEALRELPTMEVVEAPMLAEAPEFVDFLSAACRQTMLEDLKPRGVSRPLTILSAHSLPLSDLSEDDPYVRELRRVAGLVAVGAGFAAGSDFEDDDRLPGIASFGELGPIPWVFAYQSKGARGGEWLGPDVADVARAAAEAGHDAVLSCPIGFATDHMETLYDLDVVLAEQVLDAGMEFGRAPVPNSDPQMIASLVRLTKPLLQTT